MYRELVTLILCVGTVLAAPQKNSNITYVKRQVKSEDAHPNLKSSTQESKIENIPLTIPGTFIDVNKEPSKKPVKENEEPVKPTKEQPLYNYSDRIYSIKTKPKKPKNNTEVTTVPVDVVQEADIASTDIVPSESVLTDTVVKTDNSTLEYETDVTETTDIVTEKYKEETTIATEPDVETTPTPTRVLPKLSHYGKSVSGSFSQNLIGASGKRRFRSRCRCEKIWNCAKLQISVPRCPEEYFLCCS